MFKANKKSFTLIETVVAIFIFALALGAVVGFIVAAYRTHGYAWEQSIAIDEARRGIEIMVKEIREARNGDDGSFPIEKADDKEFIFYSDIDEDGQTERVRYFLGTVNSGTQTKDCVTFLDGGSCSVSFSNFLSGTLEEAEVKVSVEGDFGRNNEYAEIYADGNYLGNVCQTGCTDCAGTWEGTKTFDVTSQAQDNIADASARVNDICDWEEPNHAMKAKFEFSFTETLSGAEHEFKKGVIEPTGSPVEYPLDQEKITILSSYVRNTPPIFRYFDKNGNEITDLPARLVDTKLIEVYLVVNVDPNRPPQDFELKSSIQLRNLKEE
jgi:type II secretory pathway pseudopilin PulG